MSKRIVMVVIGCWLVVPMMFVQSSDVTRINGPDWFDENYLTPPRGAGIFDRGPPTPRKHWPMLSDLFREFRNPSAALTREHFSTPPIRTRSGDSYEHAKALGNVLANCIHEIPSGDAPPMVPRDWRVTPRIDNARSFVTAGGHALPRRLYQVEYRIDGRLVKAWLVSTYPTEEAEPIELPVDVQTPQIDLRTGPSH